MYQSPKENPLYHQLIRQIKTNDIRLRTPKRGIPLAEEKAQYRLLERQQDMLYEQLRFWDELELLLKYDPNQPRVPAGHPDGGQWTDGNGAIDPVLTGATLAQGASKPGNSSWIGRAEQIGRQIDREIPLRAIVRSNPVIRSATSLLSFLKAPELEYPLAEAVQQYNAVATAEDPYVVPILSLRAKQFTKGDSDAKVWASVREVDRETVNKFCPEYFTVQTVVNKIATSMGALPEGGSPQGYGLAFHLGVELEINLIGEGRLYPELYIKKPRDGAPDEYYHERIKRKERDTVGLDIYEPVGDDLACIYDVKTGRTGFDDRRMELLSRSAAKKFPNVKHFFLIEVRPTNGYSQDR
ncbi:hypothetical protein [Phyllobacterium lublinensis]|uniref:hypothetical protein n=1 Tax=Phyllobacterium lublinensis TaxID=2875708 RepID=UPI001CCC551F|nr:hypothetical protein [Phyllobacterium sp. 2063]MBZ9656802.1 hypothetical protein [Phyllobacterium sp. 2063]